MKAGIATLAFDSTTLNSEHINAVHFSTLNGIYSASIRSIPGGRAEDYCTHALEVIEELASSYASFYRQDVHMVKSDIVAAVRSTMTDRVNTNHAAVALLEDKLEKNLLELHCNVHPLDSISKVCRAALTPFNATVPSGVFGRDCRAANLIFAISKLRYKGDGDPGGFKLYLARNQLSLGYFPRYVGNRFHVIFHMAGKIYLQRDSLAAYLKDACNNTSSLATESLLDIQKGDVLTQLQALGKN